jgi:hypothetical protein
MENALPILGFLLVLPGVILTRSWSTLVGPHVAHPWCERVLRPGSRFGLALCCAVFWLNNAPVFSQALPAVEAEVKAEPETDKAIIEQILTCLEKGQEAVLLQKQPVECAPFGKGVSRVQSSDASKNINIASICQDPGDLRRLSGNAIKLIAGQKDRISPTGIRVIGGVYCKQLDLVGVDLPYSLVLDKSVFKEGVQGRNFRTHGDLSFDKSLMFGELFLARVHVDGTIFASEAVIQKVRLLDAEVHGSALLRNSLILDLAAFDTVLLSGELSVRNSLFPYLLVQFSKISGVLDLTDSQARCSYKIRKSEIGDIVAVNSGFGTVGPPPQQVPDAKTQYDWKLDWTPPRFGPEDHAPRLKAAADNMPPNSDQSAIGRICDHSSISYLPGSILISDTKVKSSLCLRSFHWLQGAQSPISYVTVQDVSVGTAALIDLAQPDVESNSATDTSHRLEMIDLETGSLFLNFNDPQSPQPNAMYISGLKFEHVYAAEVVCLYDPIFSDSDTKKAIDAQNAAAALADRDGPGNNGKIARAVVASVRTRDLGNDADPAGHSRLPRVEEVMGWLNGNLLATTQPFEAFVDVFQKHGEDNDAKALRIAKADVELCLKARRLFGEGICGRRREAGTSTSAAPSSSDTSATSLAATKKQADPASWWNEMFSAFSRWIEFGADFVSVVLGGVLWLIADNGYHPEKVGYFVVLSIIFFSIYFWFVLRAVGLMPKEKRTILPLGIVFLFDRLLPAYQIREDHYNIAKYYMRVPKKAVKQVTGELRKMRYIGCDWPVVAATEAQRIRIERSLDVLKVLGLVLAVFLVAAINAIVSH